MQYVRVTDLGNPPLKARERVNWLYRLPKKVKRANRIARVEVSGPTVGKYTKAGIARFIKKAWGLKSMRGVKLSVVEVVERREQ